MMEPGQTFAIGGLIQTQTSGQTNKVPVLGDLPFIGTVFSTTTFTDTEQELVVLVTPYLVDAMDCRQAPCKLPGMETRSPDDFELFLELILEAPRGQREVFPNKHYQPAWMNGPSADKFPCGGAGGQCSGSGGNGRCAKGGSCQSGCGNGSCGTATWTPPPPPNSGKATAAGATGSPNSAEWVLPVTTTTQYPNLDGKP